MGKQILYLGTGRGHAERIIRGGCLFARGECTEVPESLYRELIAEEGFSAPRSEADQPEAESQPAKAKPPHGKE